jgi:hypothetical protein
VLGDRLMLGDASPGELGRSLDLPTNLLAHHVGVLESAGLIKGTRSEGDRRRTYLRPDSADTVGTGTSAPAATGAGGLRLYPQLRAIPAGRGSAGCADQRADGLGTGLLVVAVILILGPVSGAVAAARPSDADRR